MREPTEKRKSFALNSFFDEIQENFGATNKSSNIREEAFIWKGNGCGTCAQYEGQ